MFAVVYAGRIRFRSNNRCRCETWLAWRYGRHTGAYVTRLKM